MSDKKPANLLHDRPDEAASCASKEVWAKPEIVDYQPVTVARGVQYRIGDGISNLS